MIKLLDSNGKWHTNIQKIISEEVETFRIICNDGLTYSILRLDIEEIGCE